MQRLILPPAIGRFQRMCSMAIRLCSKSRNKMSSNLPTNFVDSVRLDREMLIKLERLAGLRFKSVGEVEALREEICLANRIFEVDTTGVEPLYSIVEELIDCPLREDEPVLPDKQQASKPKPSSGRVKQVGQWSEQISSAGKRYYYNVVTEVSQWDKPAEWRAYEKKLSEQRNVRSSQPSVVSQSTPTPISKNGDATISTTATMPTISSASVTKNPLSSSNSQNVHVSSSVQAQPSTSQNVISNSSMKRESGRNGSTGRSSSNTPTNQHRSSSGVGNSSGHRDHAHVNGHSSSARDHYISSRGESSSNRASTSSHHYQSSRDRHRSSDRNDREYSSKRSRSDRENQRNTPKYHSSSSNHGSREEKSRTSNSTAHPTAPTTSAPTTSTETPAHLTTDFVVSSASSIPQSSANFLQPPPPMPSVILDEPMEVVNESPVSLPTFSFCDRDISLSFSTPTFTSFDETSYIRFYNPKMNFSRRFMANDATTNELKRLSQKQWKQTKDLMEIDANIEAVRSLVLTAHNKRMLLDMKKDYLKNQAKNSTAASSSTTSFFPVCTAPGTLSDSANFSRPTSNSTPPIVNNSTNDFKSSAPKRARLEENGQTTGVTTTNNNLLTSSGFS
ncbi:WW domain-containing protein [Aphelenchoides besseyi]|nr:WW domain-containing protein [Aphelenchoides besseyi]KAI6207413.1 WW domain-containing protein [Aphelenchoides besseyi]